MRSVLALRWRRRLMLLLLLVVMAGAGRQGPRLDTYVCVLWTQIGSSAILQTNKSKRIRKEGGPIRHPALPRTVGACSSRINATADASAGAAAG